MPTAATLNLPDKYFRRYRLARLCNWLSGRGVRVIAWFFWYTNKPKFP